MEAELRLTILAPMLSVRPITVTVCFIHNSYLLACIVNFVNNLDPNTPANAPATPVSDLKGFTWPLWNSNPAAPPMLQYNAPHQISLTNDTYRKESMQLLIDLSEQLGV